jgi:PAS domain S-box
MISVLYVDSDAGLRAEVQEFLNQDSDIRVIALASAYDALDLLRERRFDVIVSESSLAVTTGVTFLEVLRRVRRDTTPFIFFAKKSTHEDTINALNTGATFYLLKGSDPRQRFLILRHYIRQAAEQHRIKEALVQSEKRYRSVVGDQSEFIIRFKRDGTLVFANDAYCRYFSLADGTLPRGRVTLPPFGKGDAFLLSLHALTREKPMDSTEYVWELPDGREAWQFWNTRAIFDEETGEVEFQSVGRDITGQKLAEQALRGALKNLGIMNSITRHDVINQLTGIYGYLQYSLELSTNPAVTSALSRAIAAAETIQAQILFTRDYQEIGCAQPRWQNLDAVVAKAAAGLDHPGVRIDCTVSDLWICADPLIEKVFFNLLENSLRHGQKISAVRISSEETGDGLVIVYEDDGVGIPAGVKEKIFRREYFHNTGLGLYLSREILANSQMQIRETGTEGCGARFEILVPKGIYGRRVPDAPAQSA